MKVVHLCLANPYIDGWGYQENTLTRVQKRLGFDVSIIASVENKKQNKFVYEEPKSYVNEFDILIERIPYISWLPMSLTKKLRLYKGLYESLEKSQPDIIFAHGLSFLDVSKVKSYIQHHPKTILYIDSHADYVNVNNSWVARKILHGIIYKHCANIITPYVRKYWGTLPLRCRFLHEVYNIPNNKIDLLPMGFDVSEIDFSKKDIIRTEIREKYNIKATDFLIVSGGKLEARKNIDILIKSVAKLQKNNVKLLVFGAPTEEIKPALDSLQEKYSNIVRLIGWVNTDDIYKYLFAADLAVFPGTHSVIWEQSVTLGVPCVFKKWDGIDHIDLGGNCKILEEINEDKLGSTIKRLVENRSELDQMRKFSEEKGKVFRYDTIAKKAIGL